VPHAETPGLLAPRGFYGLIAAKCMAWL